MDFDKLVWFLANRSLFFSRAHLLGDPFEASTPLRNISDYHELELKMDGKVPFGKRLAAVKKAFLPYYLVNCWHMNDFESAAMWRLYSRGTNSVALLTRFDLLVDVLLVDFGIGKIRYIDYANDRIPEGNVFNPIMYKRKSFQYEHEVRAVTVDKALDADTLQELHNAEEAEWKSHIANLEPGLAVSVDITHMVKGIYVSPGSPKWFVDTVKDVVKRYAYDFPAHSSELDRDPVY